MSVEYAVLRVSAAEFDALGRDGPRRCPGRLGTGTGIRVADDRV